MKSNGDSLWKKVFLDKKRIVWIKPMNGFALAALKDINFKIKLPNYLPTYDANFDAFKSLWTNLDYNLELLYENVRSHIRNDEYCCLDCHFPFARVCAKIYSQFEPVPPPQYGFHSPHT